MEKYDNEENKKIFMDKYDTFIAVAEYLKDWRPKKSPVVKKLEGILPYLEDGSSEKNAVIKRIQELNSVSPINFQEIENYITTFGFDFLQVIEAGISNLRGKHVGFNKEKRIIHNRWIEELKK